MFGEIDFDPSRTRKTESFAAQLTVLDALAKEGKVLYLGLSNEALGV